MKSKITIKKIQDLLIKGVQTIYVDDDTSRRMWWAALEVIQKDFLPQNYKQGGIWVASPLPAFNNKKFLDQLHGWLWSPEGFPYFQNENAGFLPVNNSDRIKKDFDLVSNYNTILTNPQSTSLEMIHRDTWETWDKVFKSIADDILKLKN